MTEEALVKAARRGDDAAFEELVRRYEKKVYALSLRLCGNSEDAQEAARQLLAQDPELADPRHLPIRQKVLTLFDENPDIFN